MREKRKHPRKKLHPHVRLALPNGAWASAQCCDISLGGAYVETDSVVPFGTEVVLAFELPDLDSEALIPAVVRWTKPGGMGVQFGAMGARETHGLVTLLAAADARVA